MCGLAVVVPLRACHGSPAKGLAHCRQRVWTTRQNRQDRRFDPEPSVLATVTGSSQLWACLRRWIVLSRHPSGGRVRARLASPTTAAADPALQSAKTRAGGGSAGNRAAPRSHSWRPDSPSGWCLGRRLRARARLLPPLRAGTHPPRGSGRGRGRRPPSRAHARDRSPAPLAGGLRPCPCLLQATLRRPCCRAR